MTANIPDTSDRVLAAEIYTRRIRNTVFGAILLVAWLVLLFKELGWGLAVGVLAGALYILFLLGRWIVRVCGGKGRATAPAPVATALPVAPAPVAPRRAGWLAGAVSVLVLVVTFYAGSIHVRNNFEDLIELGIDGDGDLMHGVGIILAGLLMWWAWFSVGMTVRYALVTRYVDIKLDGAFDWRRFDARAFYGLSVGWAYLWSFGAIGLVTHSHHVTERQAVIANCAWVGGAGLLMGLAVKYYVLHTTRAGVHVLDAGRMKPQAAPAPGHPGERIEPTF